MKSILNLFIFIFISGILPAQVIECGSDLYRKQNNSVQKVLENDINSKVYEAVRQSHPFFHLPAQTSLIIPVVFHIIHLNGSENISDSEVYDLINIMNARFQNESPFFDPQGIAVGIQFCLASVDPLGRPTTGITRDISTLTDVVMAGPFSNDIQLKNINRWNPELYLNIWLVRSIMPSVVAYSSMPEQAGGPEDGIVAIALMSLAHSELLTHEAGHYLGLYHTFQNTEDCLNDNCLLNGDLICDTPPDFSVYVECPSNSCHTELNDTSGYSPFSTDVDDLPNYMDYTECPDLFTQGQSERMHAVLAIVRQNLLLSNGCGMNPGGTIPVADFTHALSCNGERFINTSTNSLCAEWDFENDGIYDGMGDTVSFNYPATGEYSIKMRATGFGGADSVVYNHMVHVRPFPDYPVLYHSGYGFSPFTGGLYSCQGTVVTIYGWPGLTAYQWSDGSTGQNLSFVADSTFEFSLTATDTTGFIWTSCPDPIHVEVAPALNKPLIFNNGSEIICMNSEISFYTPSIQGEVVYAWFHEQLFLTTDTLFTTIAGGWNDFIYVTSRDINGCMMNSDTTFLLSDSAVGLPYHMTQKDFVLYGKEGWNNQFYRNGIIIPGATAEFYVVTEPGCYSVSTWHLYPECSVMSDTICFVTVGKDEPEPEVRWRVYPNPAKGKLFIRGRLKEPALFTLVNTLQQEVSSLSLTGSSEQELQLSHLLPGIYFWRIITSSGIEKTGKILLQ